MPIYTTMPTRPVIAVDIPEPTNFNSSFVYGFFTQDESVNDLGTDLTQFENIETLQDKLSRDVPRYISLSWSKPPPVIDANDKNKNLIGDIVLSEVYDTVVSEFQFSTTSFTGLSFQDNSIDQKLFTLVSGTITRNKNLFNSGLTTAYNQIVENINESLKLEPFLLQDAAKLITIGDTTVDNVIVDALSSIEQLNALYKTDDGLLSIVNKRFELIKDVKLDMQLNTKLAYTVLHDVTTDPVGTFTDELAPIMEKVRKAQISAIEAIDPNVIDINNYELYIEPTFVEDVDVGFEYYNTPRKMVGYIIDRYEVRSDGSRIKIEPPIIVDDINITVAYDPKIKYGKRYLYEIRSVVAIKFLIIQDDTTKLATALIKSRPITTIVDTTDTVPPPWPADFQISWDRKRKKPRLMWSYPVNKQKDIKKFQIFRRSSVDEPYQLIKQYNFDDSQILYPSGENPNPELVEFTARPPLHFIDEEFNVNSTYMYTMGCIDAHGLVSNFSSQIQITFDPIKNGVKRRLISGPNAPRPYPNMYLEQEDAIVDLIRDSRHSKIRLYFDPEYVDVFKNMPNPSGGYSAESVGLLPIANSEAKYTDSPRPPGFKLQILNTDLQQTKTVDIIVNNRLKIQKFIVNNNKPKIVQKTPATQP